MVYTTGFFDGEPGLVAIYTSAVFYPNSSRPRQLQSLAYSKDNGRTWLKYEGNPVLSDAKITDYRDPKVFWHDETKKWVMVLATGQSITIYTSPNLIDWEYGSEFGNKAGSHEGVWECPDLFKLSVDGNKENEKWVMLVSIGDDGQSIEGSRTQYFIGHFDGTTFLNDNDDETILWLDYGPDNYAGVSWSDIQDGRRIYLGWMSNWRYANEVPTKGWRSAMTLPRELILASLDSGIRLVQQPVSEMSVIRKEQVVHKVSTIQPNSVVSIPLNNDLLEINIEFEMDGSSQVGCIIQHSEKDKTTVSYHVLEELLLVDRTHSGDSSFSASFPTIQEAPLKLKDTKLKLQLFLDTSSIKVFANDGEVAVTSLIFPSGDPKELVLFSKEGSTNVGTLTLTELNSIWSS